MPEILTNQVGPEKQFYDFLSDGKIKIQRNKNTGEFFFHPRVAFPGTGERELEWVEISGKGIVHSSSCNRRLPEKGGDFNLSIIIVVNHLLLKNPLGSFKKLIPSTLPKISK